jgi:hypothetical protein
MTATLQQCRNRLQGRRSIVELIERHWPLIVATGILWATIGLVLIQSLEQTQGHLVYALDDPYISMSMAKNLAGHGVWGINKDEFSSASSSLLWTLLLSLVYGVVGVHEVSPLILNLLFATLLVSGAYLVVRRYTSQRVFILLVLVAIIFLSPLASLIFCGLEHVAHTLLTILFVYVSARSLSEEKPESRDYLLSLSLAPLVTLARFEGLFLVFVVCVLFLLRKRLVHSICLGAAGILPIVIYGIISVSHGSFFLPNPILLKGNVPDLSSFGGIVPVLDFTTFLPRMGRLRILLLLGVFVLVLRLLSGQGKAMWKSSTIMLMAFIGTFILHMQLARTGWFYRYEAYLVALGILVIAVGGWECYSEGAAIRNLKNQILKYAVLPLIGVALLTLFWQRAFVSLRSTPHATANIYQQQYHMGLFLRDFYQGKAIAANDVGAVSFLADITCLDLFGLACEEVTGLKREGLFSTKHIDRLTKQRNVRIALLYDDWFGGEVGSLPPQWLRCGDWTILNNIVCGSPTVSFYAVDSLEAVLLINNLRAFSSRLPREVVQSGGYTDNGVGDR